MMEQNHKHHRRRRLDRIASFNNKCNKFSCLKMPTNIKSVYCKFLTITLALICLIIAPQCTNAQQQNFLQPGHDLRDFHLSEITPINTIVYQLKAVDRSNENRKFSYYMTADTFNVDEHTGEVRLVKSLDRERQANITAVVTVTDNSDSVESKKRIIFVDDVDDSLPIFAPHKHSIMNNPLQSQYAFQVEVSELATIGSIVLGEILVTDADQGENADTVFECRAKQSTTSACDSFTIESRRLNSGRYSVTVRTRKLLDFERVPTYKLALVARGKNLSPLKAAPLEATAMININLINIQDEGPVFVNAPYSLSMEEGLKTGTRLLNLIVQDGDAAPQRELSMIVVPSLYSDYFQVFKDPELTRVWYLETNTAIDRENPIVSGAGNIFTISLLAAELDDSGHPIANETELGIALREPTYAKGTLRKENVTVVVMDKPDSRPEFIQVSTGKPFKNSVMEFNLSEAISSGTSIPNLDLAVQDLDQGINSRFNLSLMDSPSGPPASSVFALESSVIYGKADIVLHIINSTLIDYENPLLRSYKFNLVASKNLDPPLVQILEVHLNIVDANDNVPEFDREQYVVQVPEESPPGTVVATIKAKDKDSAAFGMINYTLRGSGAYKFNVVPNEGKIVISDCGVPRCIDYEVQSSYSLTYEARDGGGRMKNVSVIINVVDINDHPPKFTESVYKRELISDNLSSKQNYISPQLILRAKDEDGRNNISYRIKSTNLTGLDVDPVSGLVYLSQPLDLDNLISSMHKTQGRSMDRRIVFEAEVVAEDSGSPPLNSTARIVLVVKGNREGAPQFKQDLYQAIVRENQPVNKTFFQVQASDPDDKDSGLRYSLGYDLNDLISINQLFGELSFKRKVDYDDFKDSAYNITVFATDNSKPYPLQASAIVSILVQDVNDKSPKFEQQEYQATLTQGRTKPSSIVLHVIAVDLDKNAQLNYSIVGNELTVRDRNGQEFSLEELSNSTSGYLAQMSKIDRLQLINALRDLFHINKKNGAIELKNEPDYQFAASITIQVRVVDLNQEVYTATGDMQQDFATCTFFLQTHIDKSPIFAPPWSIEKPDYSISIMEELNVGTPIFSFLAKDPTSNERIDTYDKVYESDPKDYFKVERSGIVSINRRVDLEDLPGSKKLTLSVKALTNDVYSSIANLNIKVIDLNDNAPIFKNQSYAIRVSESISYPNELLTVNAEDRDSKDFSQVYYSLAGHSSDFFSIDSKKGAISIKKGVKLDRDTEPNHSLMVTAADCNETNAKILDHQENFNCKKSTVFINITLNDENDNDPTFLNVNKRGEFEALVSETVSIGAKIAQVIAMDADEGANGQVGYEIAHGDDQVSNLFRIDQEGYIAVAESLSGLGRSSPYKITLIAHDHGKTSRQSYATLLLTISDVVSNDGVPKFVNPKVGEIIELTEIAGPGTFVYQVRAIDPDEETNGKIMYKFIQPSEVFDIDPFTGVIKTQYRSNLYLDREVAPEYTLIVVAQDLGSPSKQAHQVVKVQITDINDNEPYFERGIDDLPLRLYVEEEVPKDFVIGTLQALDRDTGSNALIGYEIIEGNINNLFRLSYELDANSSLTGNNPCKIYSTSRLDRETRENYLLTIKATSISKLRNPFIHQLRDSATGWNPFNQYNASDLTKLRVEIKLIDINDNRPVFLQPNAKSVVDSTAETYSQLMVFKASDADSSNPEIQYSILETIYYGDSRARSSGDGYKNDNSMFIQSSTQSLSLRHIFDMDQQTGILRNAASLRSYTDGYFEVFVKADSGSFNQLQALDNHYELDSANIASSKIVGDQLANKCRNQNSESESGSNSTSGPFADLESCFVAVTKATIFVTHQRETFRFVFNKTKLSDRLDEFKRSVQDALEEMMFNPPQASIDAKSGRQEIPRAEKVYLNTFNTDFYERDDGSLDFSTLTSCSQLVKFDDRTNLEEASRPYDPNSYNAAPNQVISYEEVMTLLKSLNTTQSRQQKGSLFNQYGLVGVERCVPDKTTYKMTLPERLALYFAIAIALISILLAFIVSRMRKSYEKNLKLLQRSKYQYMSQYATLPPGRQAHHMSLGTLPGSNFMAPPYGSHVDFEGPTYDTWQL